MEHIQFERAAAVWFQKKGETKHWEIPSLHGTVLTDVNRPSAIQNTISEPIKEGVFVHRSTHTITEKSCSHTEIKIAR